ncbi:1, 4-beta cellobiohydrolase [Geopyxis carbonaria]|nr:1, 4-beta cellobiohydrolase [Geopyxis carbonaria]
MHSFLPLLALAAAATASAAAVLPPCNANNPFLHRTQYANSAYAAKLEQTIASFTAQNDTLNAARTRTVQSASTFIWISDFAGVRSFETHLAEAQRAGRRTPGKKLLVPFVVYNLPDRDCSAKASAGELSLDDGGEEKYRLFVDEVAAAIRPYDRLEFAVILEPDSLGNAVTNMANERCAKAAPAYKRGVAYAIQKLQQRNVALYIDAAHSNWLGWPGNLEPTAKIFGEVLSLANGNATANSTAATNKIRGFATNVSNYNGYNPSTPDPIYGAGPDNPNWSELRYAHALTPYLAAQGLPAQFIIDQGRSGVQNLRETGGNWCNIDGAGFGRRPTAATGDCSVDAIIWGKPGGESDGTSAANATRFDENCVSEDAKTPAPEAGAWFDEFVQMLVKNANPLLEPTYLGRRA